MMLTGHCGKVVRGNSASSKTMTIFASWEDFANAAEKLYVEDPLKVAHVI